MSDPNQLDCLCRWSGEPGTSWTGTLVYSAYTYAIYAFDVHFGPLFLL